MKLLHTLPLSLVSLLLVRESLASSFPGSGTYILVKNEHEQQQKYPIYLHKKLKRIDEDIEEVFPDISNGFQYLHFDEITPQGIEMLAPEILSSLSLEQMAELFGASDRQYLPTLLKQEKSVEALVRAFLKSKITDYSATAVQTIGPFFICSNPELLGGPKDLAQLFGIDLDVLAESFKLALQESMAAEDIVDTIHLLGEQLKKVNGALEAEVLLSLINDAKRVGGGTLSYPWASLEPLLPQQIQQQAPAKRTLIKAAILPSRDPHYVAESDSDERTSEQAKTSDNTRNASGSAKKHQEKSSNLSSKPQRSKGSILKQKSSVQQTDFIAHQPQESGDERPKIISNPKKGQLDIFKAAKLATEFEGQLNDACRSNKNKSAAKKPDATAKQTEIDSDFVDVFPASGAISPRSRSAKEDDDKWSSGEKSLDSFKKSSVNSRSSPSNDRLPKERVYGRSKTHKSHHSEKSKSRRTSGKKSKKHKKRSKGKSYKRSGSVTSSLNSSRSDSSHHH